MSSREQRWEYRVIRATGVGLRQMIECEELERTLNELGSDGWELVACGEDKGLIFTLKRPL